MVHITPVLAETATATAGNPAAAARGLADAWQYLSGFGIVILTLALLWALTAVIGKIFVSREKAAAAKAAKRAEAEAEAEARRQKIALSAAMAHVSRTSPPVQGELSPQIMVVLTAAVHDTLRGVPHRVVAIRSGQSHWGEEGRRQIFAGRRVR